MMPVIPVGLTGDDSSITGRATGITGWKARQNGGLPWVHEGALRPVEWRGGPAQAAVRLAGRVGRDRAAGAERAGPYGMRSESFASGAWTGAADWTSSPSGCASCGRRRAGVGTWAARSTRSAPRSIRPWPPSGRPWPGADDDGARLAEMELDTLPDDVAGAVRGLSDYQWRNPEAKATYEAIQQMLQREVLDAQFAGMKQALDSPDPEAMQRVKDMLADLNPCSRRTPATRTPTNSSPTSWPSTGSSSPSSRRTSRSSSTPSPAGRPPPSG